MPFALQLYFDERTETLIRAIWEKMAETGVSQRMARRAGRPHVALAVFDDVDPGELAYLLRGLARDQAPFELRFESLGTYCSADGVLFLNPVVSPRFFLLHSTVFKLIHPMVVGLKDSCRPYRYVPHCTIAYGLDKETLARAVALFSNRALPVVGQFNRIGLFDLATNEDRCIYTFQKTLSGS